MTCFGVIRSKNRSLELTEDRFWSMGYGSDQIHLLFNIWYRDFNYTPAYENNLPQIDHIFPQSLLRQVKTTNPSTGRMNMMRYHDTEEKPTRQLHAAHATRKWRGWKIGYPQTVGSSGIGAESAYLRLH